MGLRPRTRARGAPLLMSREISIKLTKNRVTFNGSSFKVTAHFNQAQQQKLTHSTNFNSTPREYCVKLKKWAFLSFNEKFLSVFENHSTSTPYSRHILELGPSRSSSNCHHAQRNQFSHQTTKGMLSTTNSNTVNKVLSHNAISTSCTVSVVFNP